MGKAFDSLANYGLWFERLEGGGLCFSLRACSRILTQVVEALFFRRCLADWRRLALLSRSLTPPKVCLQSWQTTPQEGLMLIDQIFEVYPKDDERLVRMAHSVCDLQTSSQLLHSRIKNRYNFRVYLHHRAFTVEPKPIGTSNERGSNSILLK